MPRGQRVTLIAAVASDERDGLTYGISCPDCGEVFTMHPLTGLITLNEPLNFESRSRYDLLVIATDQPVGPADTVQRTATTVLSVHVLDENDEVPTFIRDSYTVYPFDR